MSISQTKRRLEAALVGCQRHLQQIESKMADLRRMLRKGACPPGSQARAQSRWEAKAQDESGEGRASPPRSGTLGKAKKAVV
jgi:hypothetical protein